MYSQVGSIFMNLLFHMKSLLLSMCTMPEQPFCLTDTTSPLISHHLVVADWSKTLNLGFNSRGNGSNLCFIVSPIFNHVCFKVLSGLLHFHLTCLLFLAGSFPINFDHKTRRAGLILSLVLGMFCRLYNVLNTITVLFTYGHKQFDVTHFLLHSHVAETVAGR